MAKTVPLADAPKLKVHLLDVGKQIYGDSILCQLGSELILIDGGHEKDFEGQPGCKSIPQQLTTLLGHGPPFKIALLVVTHCHADHMGCLPKMVAEPGMLEVEWALVADEGLGFGREVGGPDPIDAPDITPPMRRLLAALREEDATEPRTPQQLEALLDAATDWEPIYTQMLATLATRGTKVVRYGRDNPQTLVNRFSNFGLKIVGPKEEQLLICAEVIRADRADAIDFLRQQAADGPLDLPALFRALTSATVDADGGGTGPALNNQSIVLRLEVGGHNVLLSGDMQFATPQVSGLTPLMKELRTKIAAEAPYDLVKIAHHAASNGINQTVLDELGGTNSFVISGGSNDPGHPATPVLKLLKLHREELQWARTDKNGQITATFSTNGTTLKVAKGALNSLAVNQSSDSDVPALEPPEHPPGEEPLPPPAAGEEEAPPVAPVIKVEEANWPDVVEVTARIPHKSTRVVITVDIQPGAENRGIAAPVIPPPAAKPPVPPAPGDGELPPLVLGGVRDGGQYPRLPKLLFATDLSRLAGKIGRRGAEHLLSGLRASGQQVVDRLPADVNAAGKVVNAALTAAGPTIQGVVLLGGYDVVPAQRLDVLPKKLRARVPRPEQELDKFVVWNDDIYGCKDDDPLPDLPVSRIPDGGSVQLMLTALSSKPAFPRGKRFGIRNFYRPFAISVYDRLPGKSPLLVSRPITPDHIEHPPPAENPEVIYFMLHGDETDGTVFSGESAPEVPMEAIGVKNIPRDCSAVVFAGCCWGALCADPKAADAATPADARGRTARQSIALSFLQAGAPAFVGCTGAHYSPREKPDHFGGPLHLAFWEHLKRTARPALSLFLAKRDYLAGLPHIQEGSAANRARQEAIELKILWQFTCLGLGW